MNKKTVENLLKKFPETKINIPISPLTAYKIGGPADFFYEVANINDLPELIGFCYKNAINYYILGGGCNTVFSDKGFRGMVIKITANEIEIEGNKVIAQAGALLGQVILKAKENGLGGITKLIGLPGTIGGAVFGNAGAQGIEIKDFVEKVKLFDLEKGIHEEGPKYFEFNYRHSRLKDKKELVLEVTLSLPPLNNEDFSSSVLNFRNLKQPKGKSAGSFFKNPDPANPAGKLIDRAGLKGKRIGDIQVSELHGNWLINIGNGTQEDLIKLAKFIKKEVKNRFNIDLELENILIDEYGSLIDI
ncbi:UDP-N-acetylmuramate dehydrogenase [Candidatus Peregrinibacteria bacterium]|nr:UDP-N-acetylmuramate dehydrogenase [Candidatus Peregrinibacteria bacterium]